MRIISKLKKYEYILLLFGIILIAYSVYIFFVAPQLTYAAKPASASVMNYSFVRIIIGIIYTLSVVLLLRKKLFSGKNLVFIFIIGLISRIILIPTEPILEDDYNRYLWDGAVAAEGHNPYEYPPKFFQSDSLAQEPRELFELAELSGAIIESINHPHIRTIYPPTAQLFFAISYMINPWSNATWKFLLLIVDLIVFVLIIILLKHIKYSASLVLIYWWNPILLHEMFNAGHMDIIMYPFILGGILLLLRSNIIFSVIMFSLAVGSKIWPIIFIPFALKKTLRNKKILIIVSLLSLLLLTIILYPILITKLDNSLGLVTYTKNWTNNESIFQLVNIFSKKIIEILNINYYCSLCVARWVVFIFYTLFLILMLRSFKGDKYQLFTIFYYLVAVLYFISPTQFPWYYTWIVPFLVFKPRLSIVSYTILLPLYQLTYSRPYLVWIEHIPILMLFVGEIMNGKLRSYLSSNLETEEISSEV